MPAAAILGLAARSVRLTRPDAFYFPSSLCVVRVAFSGECARFSAGPDVRLVVRRSSGHLRHRPVRLPPAARITRNRQIGRTPLVRLRFVPYSVCRPRRTARRFHVPGHPASALGRRPAPTCHRSPSPMRFFVRLARLRCFRVELNGDAPPAACHSWLSFLSAHVPDCRSRAVLAAWPGGLHAPGDAHGIVIALRSVAPRPRG